MPGRRVFTVILSLLVSCPHSAISSTSTKGEMAITIVPKDEKLTEITANDENLMTMQNYQHIQLNTVNEIHDELNNDLNVTMKSSKDDSAVKSNDCENKFRDQVLGGLIDKEDKVEKRTSMANATSNNNTQLSTIETFIPEKSNQSSTTTSKNSICNNFLSKTIKQVSISENTSNSSTSTLHSHNLENLTINLDSIPKFSNEEYRRMFTKLLRREYSSNILDNLFEEEEQLDDCLHNHKITERMRCRMIDWMIEVLINYKCDEFTFFYAINIMDRYFKAIESEKCLNPSDLHLIGVTAMFMSSKYQDIYPLRLRTVYEKIGHKKLSQNDIKAKEEHLSKTLGYIIGKPTQWDFINHFLEEIFFTKYNNNYVTNKTLCQYLGTHKGEKDKDITNLFNKVYTLNMLNLLKYVAIYLAKMNCHDYSLMIKMPSLVAASTIYVAMKICEQINKEEYVNDYFTKKLVLISRKTESDIIKCSQKILHNAQNFDSIFSGLENLKRVYFNAIIELKVTK